jgi:hypothetical protein
MTREEFTKYLDDKGISYGIEGDKIVVTEKGTVDLQSLPSLPPGVVFNNGDDVYLNPLESLPHGLEFNNGGDVWLSSLTSLTPGVVFNNEGSVGLKSIIGGRFSTWKGNIEGVDSTRLLNVMISKGVFQK